MSANAEDVRAMIQDEPPLGRHVARFARDGFFSPATVKDGLEKLHSVSAKVKGTLISGFNSAHSGHVFCPFRPAEFKADAITGYAKFLHLGTTRIWNKDGSVNEERWQKLVDFVQENQGPQQSKFLTKSTLMKYLQFCLVNDPQESDTARNSRDWFSFSAIQSMSAKLAWNEVFDRLACGWIYVEATRDFDPLIRLDLVRLFFENSVEAFQLAETEALPALKPGGSVRVGAALGQK